MNRVLTFAALLLLALIAGAAPTLSLNRTAPEEQTPAPEGHCQVIEVAVDEPEFEILGEGGGALRINATFGAGVTPARQAVLQQAIDEWQGIIQAAGSTPNPFPISFSFTAFTPGSTLLANTTTTFNLQSGNLISAAMSFNTNQTFYEDPTPADDSEFTGGSPPAGTDLLTVARHEIGHAVGWTGTRRVTNLTAGGVFNAPRLNIATVTTGGTHVDPSWLPNDVMVPTIGASTRRPISLYPSASLVARAYGYRIPMQFIDGTHTGTQLGTAQQPWRTLATACGSSPVGTPLLLANSTHLVPVNFSCATRHDLNAARGGAVIRR